jgi:hypothetical protein
MSFAQGQDWSSAGWGSKGPQRGVSKDAVLNQARRAGNVVTENRRTLRMAGA